MLAKMTDAKLREKLSFRSILDQTVFLSPHSSATLSQMLSFADSAAYALSSKYLLCFTGMTKWLKIVLLIF